MEIWSNLLHYKLHHDANIIVRVVVDSHSYLSNS